ncbi:MAG: transglutaminase domain-containing protein, partial [Chitinophagaceae bacterium]
ETYNATQRSLLFIAAILVIIPLAPYINRFIPVVQIGEWNFDFVISLILAFLIARIILWIFKPLIIPALAIIMAVLLWNSFRKEYTFSNVYTDYKSMVLENWITKDEKQSEVLNIHPEIVETGMAKTVSGIRSKMNYKDSVVRNFAVQHSLDYFQDYYTKYGQEVRFLSLFKYIRKNFNYVPDPKRDEYFATPRETILNGLGGDCDDHAILMASCLRSIGGITRIVIIKGHAYPELYCGDKKDFEEMKSAIVLLFNNPPVRQLYFHEHGGQYWINMDYTADHPGGHYLNKDVLAVVDW